MLESIAASRAPSVFASAVSASSAGQSLPDVVICDSLPFDTPITPAKSVRVIPSRFRYSLNSMCDGLAYLNSELQAQSLDQRNAFGGGGAYYRPMADPRPDWFLKQWLKATGKKQADIVRDLDWNKAKVSLMVNLKQPYTRAEVNELAEYLNIRPHELLMDPEDAFALRRLKAEMVRLVHEAETVPDDPPAKKVSLN